MPLRPTTTSQSSATAERQQSSPERRHHEKSSDGASSSIRSNPNNYDYQVAEAGIVLYAGTNIVSPGIESLHDRARSTRPTFGWSGDTKKKALLANEDRECVAMQPSAPPNRGRRAKVRFFKAKNSAHLNVLGLVVVSRRRGYTATRQVLVDVQSLGSGIAAMRRLERDGIYTGACRLPWQSPGTAPEGLRIGTQELVRRGESFDIIPEIASVITASVTDIACSTPHAYRTADLRAQFGPDRWVRYPSWPSATGADLPHHGGSEV